VRGCDPQPGAYSTLKGKKIRLYNALLTEATEEISPGQIIGIDGGAVVVALNGGALKIGKFKADKGAKLVADEFVKDTDLKVGMKFGS
jgi:methionyl-tRNA formyltransferase